MINFFVIFECFQNEMIYLLFTNNNYIEIFLNSEYSKTDKTILQNLVELNYIELINSKETKITDNNKLILHEYKINNDPRNPDIGDPDSRYFKFMNKFFINNLHNIKFIPIDIIDQIVNNLKKKDKIKPDIIRSIKEHFVNNSIKYNNNIINIGELIIFGIYRENEKEYGKYITYNKIKNSNNIEQLKKILT